MPRSLKRRLPILVAVIFASLAQQVSGQTDGAELRDLSDHEVQAGQLRSAVTSRTLTWLTGTSANNDYISVGRMANFFGFVALRVSSGQSLTRAHVARDTLKVLEPTQINVLVALLDEQTTAHAEAQLARVEMNRMLEKSLVGELVDEAEFTALGRAYGAAEAELGRGIAQRFGQIAVSLTSDQLDQLTQIREAHVSGRPDTFKGGVNRIQWPNVDRQELVNLSARLLSWVTGTPEFNDFEVVGKPSQHFGFVSLRLASGHSVRRGAVSREVRDVLSPTQRQMLEVAVEHNTQNFPEFLKVRGALMRALEVALEGEAINTVMVRQLGGQVGEIEAQMTWAQAKAMLNVRDNLSAEQLDALIEMRAKYTVSGASTSELAPIDHGRQLFAQCVLCHATSRENAVAPSLVGILRRKIAGDKGYASYSPSLLEFAQKNGRWDMDLLSEFLRSPRSLVPGTTMGFDGISLASDRASLLEYIETLN